MPGLTSAEQARVDEANLLCVSSVLQERAVAEQDGVILHEQPADPGVYPYPSLFDTDLFKDMVEAIDAQVVEVDQCAYGGPSRKPTHLWGNGAGLPGLRRGCPGVGPHHQHKAAFGQTESGEFRTAALAAYPPQLCRAIAHYFLKAFRDMRDAGWGPGRSAPPRLPPATDHRLLAMLSWQCGVPHLE